MSKITVVAQAPYPIPISTGRHLTPGEIAEVELDDEVKSQLALGFLRRVRDVVEPPAAEEIQPARKPRATDKPAMTIRKIKYDYREQ